MESAATLARPRCLVFRIVRRESDDIKPKLSWLLSRAHRIRVSLIGKNRGRIAAFKAYDARSPGFGLADLAITYQQSGQLEQARLTTERLLAARPGFTIDSWMKTQFRADAEFEADVEALRAAGLPMAE